MSKGDKLETEIPPLGWFSRWVIAPIFAVVLCTSPIWVLFLIGGTEALIEAGFALLSLIVVFVMLVAIYTLGMYVFKKFDLEFLFQIIFILALISMALFFAGGGCPPGPYGDYVCGR